MEFTQWLGGAQGDAKVAALDTAGRADGVSRRLGGGGGGGRGTTMPSGVGGRALHAPQGIGPASLISVHVLHVHGESGT